MTLPGAPHIAYRGDALFIEDCRLADLAHRFGTPLYVYSHASMRAALAAYQRALVGRDHLVCYALKANSSLAVIQTFAHAGCGFDIVSGGELERVIAAGKLAGLTPSAVATVETFDGLTATVARYDFNSAAYLTFKFSHTPEKALASKPPQPATKDSPSPPSALKTPEEVAKEVTALNTKLNAWAYGLPEYKSRLLEKKLSDLIAKKAPAAKMPGDVKH